jgi:uncharacterized protein
MKKADLTFVADSTLGKLAKTLRLAGFDTLLDKRVPDACNLIRLAAEKRIILTRSTRVYKALASGKTLFIQDERPSVQMHQVITSLGLEPDDLRPLSRCAPCNRILDPMSKDDALCCVPEHVWNQHSVFKQCPDCKRVYWQGSHAEQWIKHMQNWF